MFLYVKNIFGYLEIYFDIWKHVSIVGNIFPYKYMDINSFYGRVKYISLYGNKFLFFLKLGNKFPLCEIYFYTFCLHGNMFPILETSCLLAKQRPQPTRRNCSNNVTHF